MKKLCVYSIIKNEIDHIEEGYNRVKSADYVYLLDTGSTDGTLEKIKELGIPHSQKIYDYFNFATARNECLSLAKEVANDDSGIFGHFDIDEYLDENCTSEIKLQWSDDYDQMSLIAHNVGDMTTPKIHSANPDLFWDYAIHETIRSRTNRNLSVGIINFTGYNHYQNLDKPRNYYERLKAALAIEGPRVRYLVYAAGEASLHNEPDNCAKYAKQAANLILNSSEEEYYLNYNGLTMCYYYISYTASTAEKLQLYLKIISLIEQNKFSKFRKIYWEIAQCYKSIGNICAAQQYLENCLAINYPGANIEGGIDDFELYNDNKIYTELELMCYYSENYLAAIGYATLANKCEESELSKNNLQLCIDKYEQNIKENLQGKLLTIGQKSSDS